MKIDWDKFYGKNYGKVMTEAEKEELLKELDAEDALVEELSVVDYM